MYEIEIKSLLGEEKKAHELRTKLSRLDPSTKLLSKHKQLNHYFVGGDVEKLQALLAPHLGQGQKEKLNAIVSRGSDFSIRTRLIDDTKLIFVIKASLDEGTSHNTISRAEFEAELQTLKLSELDQLILNAGFQYQAKWSREREEHECRSINVCLDRNAGYGWLAEFEKVADERHDLGEVRREVESLMQELGVEELPQDRLERMFAHYNEHWPEYYGTDKIFVIN